MKGFVRIALLAFVGITAIKCSKESPLTLPDDENNGAIINNALILSEKSNADADGGVLVDSEEQDNYGLRVFFQGQSQAPEAIDYSQYSLLGVYAQGTCEAQFVRSVAIDTAAKVVNYTVRVNELGNCERLVEDPNWVLVPAIPGGYDINFEVISRQK